MPNFQIETFVEPKLPAYFGSTKFDFIALSKRGEKLLMCYNEKQSLLLKINTHKNGFLIKSDKITRPSQVAILQKTLIDFRDLSKTKTIKSNIESSKNRALKISPYLKDMEYFAQEFEATKDILVEVGFGSGRHLLYQAKKHTDKIIIGIEIHKPSIEQVLKQCELQNINNIMLVDYDARTFLEFLPSNSVSQIFVHFPIPWDKKPHRRVISDEFIEESKRVLNVDGKLELRTDSDNYFTYSFYEFIKQTKVELHVNKNKDLEISSKYEDRWKKQDKDIYDITMTNADISKDIPKIKKLKFDNTVAFSDIKNTFEEKTLKGDGFFVHFEEIFEINEQEGLIRISFGASQRNERNYILIRKDEMSYLPDNVLETRDNLKSHKIILDTLGLGQ